MDTIVGLFVMAAVPGYFILQLYAARKWEGGWRWAALAPAIVMGPAIIHAALAFMAQSNLWPIFVILLAPVAFLYLVALAGIRSFAH